MGEPTVGNPFIAGIDRTGSEVVPSEVEENLTTAAREVQERVPLLYRDVTVTIPEVRDWVRELVEGAEVHRPYARIVSGRSLLLSGLTGSGKTHNAYGAVRALAVSGARCSWLVVNSADMYDGLRPYAHNDPRELMQQLKSVTLLVVDDVGVEKESAWTEQQLYRIVNHRVEHVKPTIVTTNLEPEYISSALSTRVFSRLVGMSQYVKVLGADRRVATRS